ncbi:SMP-30/gluconolactonase/LRE family protein [Sphingomonas sp.]|uniref:SMP-30/gluconolactonase/LRE family protein n=1 Tax=Sphingomonas sp. TaxID=28214 RepID=UPI001EB3AE1A|nr:SMP-30/gluconolactonase/LRE family protein [Sphingomonas sp.]MBX3595832.1 SMP-30/gluconolactonase/LRE family protein [Sphingomonas sp.]
MGHNPVIGRIARSAPDLLGEGPTWSVRDQALYWVDILGRKLFRMKWPSREVSGWTMPEPIGWVVERERGGFVAGLQSGIHALDLDPFNLEFLVDPEPGLPGNRLNDAKVDWHGRLWFGTLDMGCDKPTGAFYRLGTDMECACIESGLTIPNGPAVSPDGRSMLHTDSATGRVCKYAVDADGHASAKVPFIEPGEATATPDGMTFDADGCLWIAMWGGGRVDRYNLAGELLRSIPLPVQNPTSCAFGGARLDRLFVTSAASGDAHNACAGHLYEIDAQVRGVPPFAFRG